MVYAFGEKAAAEFGLTPGAPLQPIIKSLGGEIEYSLPAEINGRLPESIVVRSDKDFTIYVPSTTSIVRDRFTIAHELGHFLLHYPKVRELQPDAVMVATRWVDENDEDQKRCEWEANWFAAAFLMPAAEFRRVCEQKGRVLRLVAAHFGVSPQPAEIRAKGLGINLA